MWGARLDAPPQLAILELPIRSIDQMLRPAGQPRGCPAFLHGCLRCGSAPTDAPRQQAVIV